MTSKVNRFLFFCLSWILLATTQPTGTLADIQWPAFLGPHQNGHAAAQPLPTDWSENHHVRWRTAIHGQGWSSPVIWDDQIWLTTASEDGKQMSVLCVDKRSGQIEHDVQLLENAEPRFKHKMNSYASPTPVVERGRVYVSFGSYGTACLDTASAQVRWQRRDLPCNHWRGPGSSPILYHDLLILHFDGYDHQYVIALDKDTGQTVWKTDREIDYQTDDGDIMKAYCTPVVATLDGVDQLISPTSKATIAYHPATGKEIWRVRYDQFSATARPLVGKDLLYLNTGFSKAQLLAVRTGGSGDITDTHVQWVAKKGIGSKPSSLLIDQLLYVVHDNGVMSCLDAQTGEPRWVHRLGGNFSASLLYAGGLIYACSEEGKTTVLRPGRAYDEVSVNQLDHGFMASPAVSDGALYLRSRTHLYRIQSD